MEFSICYRASYSDTPFAIHKHGCKDLHKERTINGATVVEVTGTLNDAMGEILDLDTVEMGYGQSDIKIFSCAK